MRLHRLLLFFGIAVQSLTSVMADPPSIDIKDAPSTERRIVATITSDAASANRWTVTRLLNGKQSSLRPGGEFTTSDRSITISPVSPGATYLIGFEYRSATGDKRLIARTVSVGQQTADDEAPVTPPAFFQTWATAEIQRRRIDALDLKYVTRGRAIAAAIQTTAANSTATTVSELNTAVLNSVVSAFPGDGQPELNGRYHALFVGFSELLTKSQVTDVQRAKAAYAELATAFDKDVKDFVNIRLPQVEKELNAKVADLIARGLLVPAGGAAEAQPRQRRKCCDCFCKCSDGFLLLMAP